MARPLRLVIPGQPLHIIQRGNNRAVTFHCRADYELFASELAQASKQEACAIHAYVLMRNHVHLLVTPSSELGPSLMMQAVGRRYVRYFNDRYERTGTLWEGRFRSTIVDSVRYFFVCSRYIELNPVRAGIVTRPDAYEWSSFGHNAIGGRDPIVTPHALYLALGARPSERRDAYRALFAVEIGDPAIGAIRRAAKRGGVLGDESFRRRAEHATGRALSNLTRGGDRRSSRFKSG
jgi:putative transposase